MKSYKLIKKYPGSPKLETIIEPPLYKLPKTEIMVAGCCLERGEYSEYWEEIIEKDYEILSFKNINAQSILTLKNGLYHYYNNLFPEDDPLDFTLESSLKKDFLKIHSIKRLSDNEIFTIGDKVDSTISDLGRATDLTGFKIIDNKLTLGLRNLGYYPLSTIILPKQPLFVTEDGVEIFGNIKLFYITKSWKISSFGYINGICNGVADHLGFDKYFYSQSKAEEYILMNKPCLSINEIVDTLRFHESSLYGYQLKELVRSKLNK